MRGKTILLASLVLWLPLFSPPSIASNWGGTKSRTIVSALSSRRYELKIKLKYSRDTVFNYSTFIDEPTYLRLECTTSIRHFTKYIREARKKLLMKKRAFSEEYFLIPGWENTVYASLEKVQLKDKYWSKTKTIFEK